MPAASGRLLVATHTFLETVHYAVWLVAIPLVGWRSAPWRLDTVPGTGRRSAARRSAAGLLMAGVFVTAVLWVCSALDSATTRQVYFTLAMVHVLAEVPFLLRAL